MCRPALHAGSAHSRLKGAYSLSRSCDLYLAQLLVDAGTHTFAEPSPTQPLPNVVTAVKGRRGGGGGGGGGGRRAVEGGSCRLGAF